VNLFVQAGRLIKVEVPLLRIDSLFEELRSEELTAQGNIVPENGRDVARTHGRVVAANLAGLAHFVRIELGLAARFQQCRRVWVDRRVLPVIARAAIIRMPPFAAVAVGVVLVVAALRRRFDLRPGYCRIPVVSTSLFVFNATGSAKKCVGTFRHGVARLANVSGLKVGDRGVVEGDYFVHRLVSRLLLFVIGCVLVMILLCFMFAFVTTEGNCKCKAVVLKFIK